MILKLPVVGDIYINSEGFHRTIKSVNYDTGIIRAYYHNNNHTYNHFNFYHLLRIFNWKSVK